MYRSPNFEGRAQKIQVRAQKRKKGLLNNQIFQNFLRVRWGFGAGGRTRTDMSLTLARF